MSPEQEFSEPECPRDEDDREGGWQTNLPPGFEFRFADILEVGLPLWNLLSQHLDPTRFMGWLPLIANIQAFAKSSRAMIEQWRLLAAAGDWETINESMEMLRALLVERGGEFLDVFPEATQILLDVETIDDALTNILGEEGGRELARALLGRIEKQLDDGVGVLLDALFSPNRELPIDRIAEFVRTFDHLFQKVLEEIILPRVISAGVDERWRSPQQSTDPSDESSKEHPPSEEE